MMTVPLTMKDSDVIAHIHHVSLVIASIFLFSCGPTPANFEGNQQSAKLSLDSKYCGFFEMQFALNRIDTTTSGKYWTLVQSSDCNCKIQWSVNGITRKTVREFEFYYARHLHFEWENEDFLVLQAHQGSDTWFQIFLPVDFGMEEFQIDNPLAYDARENLVVFEDIKGSDRGEDTIMRVVHLETKREQIIIEKSDKCVSALNHYCIDSVSIANGLLRYRWTTPDKIGNSNYKERLVKLKMLN